MCASHYRDFWGFSKASHACGCKRVERGNLITPKARRMFRYGTHVALGNNWQQRHELLLGIVVVLVVLV